MEDGAMQVVPGRSVGFMTLGSSLHEVLTTIKGDVKAFPVFELHHDQKHPVNLPLHVNLPENGIRLQFDGPDQRLRLIEVLSFPKAHLIYKDMELFKPQEVTGGRPAGPSGPSFKHIYDRLLGPTYPGEYLPPRGKASHGTYNLSYPGIAFNFPVRHSAYVPNSTNVLSSSATSPATSMAVFSGESWQKARGTLFTSTPAGPRAPSLAAKGREGCPDEIDLARIHGNGRIELVRRSSPPFWIVLSETTPQDLITELGPPESIYKKSDRRLSIHKDRRASDASDRSAPDLADDESYQGSQDGWEDADDDDDETAEAAQERAVAAAEHFYNYYHHGFDVLISQPTHVSPTVPPSGPSKHCSDEDSEPGAQPVDHLTATKIIFYGNVPGSYQFNRHRRSRWTLEHIDAGSESRPLNSEMPFSKLRPRLQETFKTFYENAEEEHLQQRGMALNRGWADSPSSSTELLGGLEDSAGKKSGFARAGSSLVADDDEVGNVHLFGFPGLVFEVLNNDVVSVLTVY